MALDPKPTASRAPRAANAKDRLFAWLTLAAGAVMCIAAVLLS